MILIGIIIVIICLIGWMWFKNDGEWYFNYYILHQGMPPHYCDPGPCDVNNNTRNNLPKNLTLDMLKNMEYHFNGKNIKLENGRFLLEPLDGDVQNKNDYYVEFENVFYGDLNNDGQEDAIVVLVSRYGGTGFTRQLAAVLNQNGYPKNIANVELVGDRITINSLMIGGNGIFINMTPWDGGIGKPENIQYKLVGDKFEIVK